MITETIDRMIINHPRGLHVGVTNRGADKAEATLL